MSSLSHRTAIRKSHPGSIYYSGGWWVKALNWKQNSLNLKEQKPSSNVKAHFTGILM